MGGESESQNAEAVTSEIQKKDEIADQPAPPKDSEATGQESVSACEDEALAGVKEEGLDGRGTGTQPASGDDSCAPSTLAGGVGIETPLDGGEEPVIDSRVHKTPRSPEVTLAESMIPSPPSGALRKSMHMQSPAAPPSKLPSPGHAMARQETGMGSMSGHGKETTPSSCTAIRDGAGSRKRATSSSSKSELKQRPLTEAALRRQQKSLEGGSADSRASKGKGVMSATASSARKSIGAMSTTTGLTRTSTSTKKTWGARDPEEFKKNNVSFFVYNKLVGESDGGKQLPMEEFDEIKQKYKETRPNRLYVMWKNMKTGAECIRAGRPINLCFCGHAFKSHAWYETETKKVDCRVPGCKCGMYRYANHQGSWMITCRCKHSVADHRHDGVMAKCTGKGCDCKEFFTTFRCHCGDQWGDHETFIENSEERKARGMTLDEEATHSRIKEKPGLQCLCSGCKNLMGCQKNKAYRGQAVTKGK